MNKNAAKVQLYNTTTTEKKELKYAGTKCTSLAIENSCPHGNGAEDYEQ